MARKQSASSPQGRLVRKSVDDILRDAEKPESIGRLKKLAAKPASEIDTSDLPEITDEELSGMIPLRDWFAIRRKKERLTVRIDKDVVAWLRSEGNGYQTRMNEILREAMRQSKRPG